MPRAEGCGGRVFVWVVFSLVFVLPAFYCHCEIVQVGLGIFDVGGESGIFVGVNMFKAVQCKLSSVIFVSFLSPYLYPLFILRAPTPSFIAGCATVAVAATAAVS